MWCNKIKTIAQLFSACFFSLICANCAFTDYGRRINDEHLAIVRLEEKRHKLETQLIIVMNNLELNQGDPKLMAERDKIQRKLQEYSVKITENRTVYDRSILEWEQKLIEDRIQQQMIEKEEQEAAGREEPPLE